MRGVLWVPWKFRLPAFSLLSSRLIQRGLVRRGVEPLLERLSHGKGLAESGTT